MKKHVWIETKRLLLRDYVPSDWKAVNEYASDPTVVRFMPWGPNSPAQTRDFLRLARKEALQEPRFRFGLAVVLKSENRLIGGCGIRVKNQVFREGDLGYVLNRRYWGKGYATEAARVLVRFGFSK